MRNKPPKDATMQNQKQPCLQQPSNNATSKVAMLRNLHPMLDSRWHACNEICSFDVERRNHTYRYPDADLFSWKSPNQVVADRKKRLRRFVQKRPASFPRIFDVDSIGMVHDDVGNVETMGVQRCPVTMMKQRLQFSKLPRLQTRPRTANIAHRHDSACRIMPCMNADKNARLTRNSVPNKIAGCPTMTVLNAMVGVGAGEVRHIKCALRAQHL